MYSEPLGKTAPGFPRSKFHLGDLGSEQGIAAFFFFFLIQNVFLSLMALEEELNEQHFFGSERHRQAR